MDGADSQDPLSRFLERGKKILAKREAELQRDIDEGLTLFGDLCRKDLAELLGGKDKAQRVEAYCARCLFPSVTLPDEGPPFWELQRSALKRIEKCSSDLRSQLLAHPFLWRQLFGIGAVLNTESECGPVVLAEGEPQILGELEDLARRAAAASGGWARKRGKRPVHRELHDLLASLRLFLVDEGLADATGEGSKMVRVCECIASELELSGDARAVLRARKKTSDRYRGTLNRQKPRTPEGADI
jgi:hypothetical protein